MTSLPAPSSHGGVEPDIARLTARAELIVEELDTVVQQLSILLRRQAGHE